MSTSNKPGNTGTRQSGSALAIPIDPAQQQAAYATFGRAVAHYFSSGSQTMNLDNWLNLVATGGAGMTPGMIGTTTTTSSSTQTKSHHKKATPAQRAALERARAAAAKARSK